MVSAQDLASTESGDQVRLFNLLLPLMLILLSYSSYDNETRQDTGSLCVDLLSCLWLAYFNPRRYDILQVIRSYCEDDM